MSKQCDVVIKKREQIKKNRYMQSEKDEERRVTKSNQIKLTGFYNCCLGQGFQCIKCDFLRHRIGVLCIRHYSERSATQYVLQLELRTIKNKFLRNCKCNHDFNDGLMEELDGNSN